MFIFRSILRPDMAFRLSVESEGRHVLGVDTSQEKFDKNRFQITVIKNLTRGRPVAICINPIRDSNAEAVMLYLYGELGTRLKKAGFNPTIEIENEFDEEGTVTESMIFIKPR